MGALAHCGGREKCQRLLALGINFIGEPENGQNSSSVRPTTALSSLSLGT
jgi:hypothetical protein